MVVDRTGVAVGYHGELLAPVRRAGDSPTAWLQAIYISIRVGAGGSTVAYCMHMFEHPHRCTPHRSCGPQLDSTCYVAWGTCRSTIRSQK